MPFWLHEPSLIRCYKNLSRAHALALSGLIVGVLIGVVTYMVVRPVWCQVRQHTHDAHRLAQQRESVQQALAMLREQNTLQEELVDKHAALMPHYPPLQQTLKQLLASLHDYNLSCQLLECSQLPAPSTDEQQGRYHFAMQAKGRFADVLAFLQAMPERHKNIACSAFHLYKGKRDTVIFKATMHIMALQEIV